MNEDRYFTISCTIVFNGNIMGMNNMSITCFDGRYISRKDICGIVARDYKKDHDIILLPENINVINIMELNKSDFEDYLEEKTDEAD